MKLRQISEEFYLYKINKNYEMSILDTETDNVEYIRSQFNDETKTLHVNLTQELLDLSHDDILNAIILLLSNSKNVNVEFNNADSELIDELIDSGNLKLIDNILVNSTKFKGVNKQHFEQSLTSPFRAHAGEKSAKKSIIKNSSSQLIEAVKYHAKELNGKRWPALEYAFMQRANTYTTKSDYTKPRVLLFTYLNNLNERWEIGEKYANAALDKYLRPGGTRYLALNDEIIRYILGNHEALKITATIGLEYYVDLITNIKQHIEKHIKTVATNPTAISNYYTIDNFMRPNDRNFTIDVAIRYFKLQPFPDTIIINKSKVAKVWYDYVKNNKAFNLLSKVSNS